MATHVTKKSIFDDLGFDQEESQNLKIRAVLMNAIINYINDHSLTQNDAAKILGVSQPRVSNLFHGKINLFSIDVLITMLSKLHISVALVIDDRLAA